MAQLFGFEIKRLADEQQKDLPSFAPTKDSDDGAVVVSAGGSFGTYVDLDGTIRSEAELVSKYREMALQPECDSAIDEIVNESIALDEKEMVRINLEELKVGDKVKKAIEEEFKNCLNILDFNKFAYEIYRRWYIDGRLYYHVVIDEKNPREGIKELRYIDPRKIRKVREVQKKKIQSDTPSEAVMQKTINEYYIFNDKGFSLTNKTGSTATSGLKVAKDSIVHVVSGLTDNNGSMVLSYLHKAIKSLNQLRTLEDALVIYRLARAPERRVWYIDVGNLPKMKAEQYVRDIMVKHKNRLVYDAQSGEIRDDRKFMSMLEDYWLPRREGGRGTEVTTLKGGDNLSQMDDVLYFQKKFLQTLNVPVSRLNSDALFSLGRATEITRDELKFMRFVARLRARFAILFSKVLERQLILKQIITPEDWDVIDNNIKFDFAVDNYFSELKDAEILDGRLNQARNIQEFSEKYYSHEWIRKNVLKQTDDDIEENDSQIAEEIASGEPRWINPLIQPLEQEASGEEGPNGPEAPKKDDKEEGNRNEEMRQAIAFVKAMKERGVDNRTMQEQSKYKAAVQIIAKNPDLAKSMGAEM